MIDVFLLAIYSLGQLESDWFKWIDRGGATAVLILVLLLFLRNTIMLTRIHDKAMGRCTEEARRKDQEIQFWQSLALDMLGAGDRAAATAHRAAAIAERAVSKAAEAES